MPCPGSRPPATEAEWVWSLMDELSCLYGRAWVDREVERAKGSPLPLSECLRRARDRAALYGPEPAGERPVGFLSAKPKED